MNNSKYYPTIRLLRALSVMKRRVVLPFRLFSSGFLDSESYYPELTRKNKLQITIDNLIHIARYGSIDYHYFSYGLDIKHFRNSRDYWDDSYFLWKAQVVNTICAHRDYSCILRDKRLFSEIIPQWGACTPKTIYLPKATLSFKAIDDVLNSIGYFFFKPVDGECGHGVFQVEMNQGQPVVNGQNYNYEEAKEVIINLMTGKPYIIQEKIIQHPSISKIYDLSVNTVRLITMFDSYNNKVVPLSAVLRCGTHGNVVDNWAAGGLAIGININDGRLMEYGMYKYGKGTKTKEHPDTGFVFDKYVLPYFEEAKQQAVSLHERLLPMVIVGWDIAITEGGPVFIEGNDNMEISINQEVHGGLKALVKSINPII